MKTVNDITQDLLDLTQRGRLTWSAELQPFYRASISPDYTVRILSWHDSDLDENKISVILEKDAIEIDRTSADRFSPNFGILSALYEAARRDALKVDESIDHVAKLLAGMKR